jgi:acyl dehydratase
MTRPDLHQAQAGQWLPPLSLPPVDRTTLALFAGASGDHNPIHIDLDFARQAGQPDVFAHGMLAMAWMGRLLLHWVDQAQIRRFDARFLGVTRLAEALTCTGQVVERLDLDGLPVLRVALLAGNQHGEARLAGEALLACIDVRTGQGDTP